MTLPANEADRIIVEAASTERLLTNAERRFVLEHIASAGFDPDAREFAGGRLAGRRWHGVMLRGRDRLSAAEAHYLRHAVTGREWPPGTTFDGFVESLRAVIRDPASGVLTSRFRGVWQLAVVRRSGALRGPEGYEWLMVEYRVSLRHWVTAFQLREGLAEFEKDVREQVRWHRPPS